MEASQSLLFIELSAPLWSLQIICKFPLGWQPITVKITDRLIASLFVHTYGQIIQTYLSILLMYFLFNNTHTNLS